MLFTIMTMKKITTQKPFIYSINKTKERCKHIIDKFLNKKIETNLYHHKDYQKMYQKN